MTPLIRVIIIIPPIIIVVPATIKQTIFVIIKQIYLYISNLVDGFRRFRLIVNHMYSDGFIVLGIRQYIVSGLFCYSLNRPVVGDKLIVIFHITRKLEWPIGWFA